MKRDVVHWLLVLLPLYTKPLITNCWQILTPNLASLACHYSQPCLPTLPGVPHAHMNPLLCSFRIFQVNSCEIARKCSAEGSYLHAVPWYISSMAMHMWVSSPVVPHRASLALMLQRTTLSSLTPQPTMLASWHYNRTLGRITGI